MHLYLYNFSIAILSFSAAVHINEMPYITGLQALGQFEWTPEELKLKERAIQMMISFVRNGYDIILLRSGFPQNIVNGLAFHHDYICILSHYNTIDPQ